LIGTIATTVLIVRVILQKRRVGQRALWQRNRKMVLQLSSISIMYIIVWIPSILCYLIALIFQIAFAFDLASNVFIYFKYITSLLCPFMCLVGLPEVFQSIKQIFTRFNTVQPLVQTVGASLIPLQQLRLQQNHAVPTVIT
jgi:cytochrome c biogenesis protein CcdA